MSDGGYALTTINKSATDSESVIIAKLGDDLTAWFNWYLTADVEPDSHSYRAKKRDLEWFLGFFNETTGGYQCDQWTRSLSKSFISWLLKQHSEKTGRRLAPNTCRRIVDTLKRTARWIHRQRPFMAGYPFAEIRDITVDEPAWQGLTDLQVRRLKAAAEQLMQINRRKDQTPRRNYAMLLVLLDTGLRAFELCSLMGHDYRGGALHNIRRKGQSLVTLKIPLSRDACEALDSYIAEERKDGRWALFQSKNGEPISQQVIDQALRRVAAHANSKLPAEQAIKLSPHLLRHTALRKWADKKGVRYARQISGQVSDRYIWRYVQPSEQEARDAVEELWE